MTDSKASMTAKICSFARAYHSNFSKAKIFDDYLAFDLIGKEAYDQISAMIHRDFDIFKDQQEDNGVNKSTGEVLREYLLPILLSRMRYSEDRLISFSENQGECQYVICGAGFDTFAFRNQNPGLRVFEIDHPATQREKLGRIAQLEWKIPENICFVPVDFENDTLGDALLNAGFDPEKKTFFSILGVAYYLTLPVLEQTIREIAALSRPGNLMLFDYPDATTTASAALSRFGLLAEITSYLGEIMNDGFTYAALKGALKNHDFQIEERLTPQQIQKRFFSGNPEPYRAYENVHFIAAVCRKEA